MKVVLIFDHFGPYHLARARAAAKVMNLACIELHAKSRSYGWGVDEEKAGVNLVSLLNVGGHGKSERKRLEPHLAAVLDKAKPDVVAINGWGDFMSLESLRWCVRNGVPAIVMSESTALDEPRRGYREFLKGRIVRMFSAGLAGGSPQKDYLVQLGMAATDVEIGYDAVDNEYFAAKAAEVRNAWPVKSEEWRVTGGGGDLKFEISEGGQSGGGGERTSDLKLGISKVCEKYFLASARFILKKNLDRLIEAYAKYRDSVQCAVSSVQPDERCRTPWSLVLLGDGELRGKLVRQAEDLGLEVREGVPWEADSEGHGVLWMPGFRQIKELPRFYAGAGCFVHASTTEQWGLVVNEAMASGLPVIVSERCGCARDLIDEGVNGFCFDPGKPEELVKLMLKVSAPDFPRQEFGEASRRIIAGFGPERFASGLQAAAGKAMKNGAHRAPWADLVILNLLCRR